jgi:hypothetical protein
MNPRSVALAFALALAASGCKGQSVEPRSRFVEDGIEKSQEGVWAGERIEVDNAGVTPAGGLALTVTATDRVHATARMLAIADTENKPAADAAIIAAKDRFTVATNAGVTSVRCEHQPEAGCDALDVTVPAGTPAMRLAVVARSGSGKVGVSFDGAELGELDLHASQGAIDVATPAPQGASITIVSETNDEVTLRLPADFAADAIVLDAPAGNVDTSAFPDLRANSTTRGAAGAGAKTISVRGGRIVLAVH